MEVREAQRQGALVLLFLGLVVYGVATLTLSGPAQVPSIPWINQEVWSFVLEVGGDSKKAGICFFPASANLAGVLKELGVDDLLSPEQLRDALISTDTALKVVVEQGGARLVAMAAVSRLALGLPVNLNKVTEEELTAVPGIGGKTASRIAKLRRIKGRIKSIDELAEIPGINERKLKTLKDYLITGNGSENAVRPGTVGFGGPLFQ